MFIAWDNVLDLLSADDLDVSGGTPTLPAANLLDPRLESVFRVPFAAAGVECEFDVVNAGLFLPPNFQIQAILGSDVAGPSGSVSNDTELASIWVSDFINIGTIVDETGLIQPNYVQVHASSFTARNTDLRVYAASGEFQQVARVWSGPVWDLPGTAQASWSDTGRMNRSDLGYGFKREGVRYRKWTVRVPLVTTDEAWNDTANNFFEAVRELAVGQEMLFVPFVDDPNDSAHDGYLTQKGFTYGRLAAQAELKTQGGDYWGVQMTIEETK
ncbi:MAG: hypothetical protein AAF358_13775 [Pseudomonadota bacterium]